MRFAFRVDSSPKIGMGHLMRCLTLANGLKQRGFKCYFICREFVGNGAKLIEESGFQLNLLSTEGIELEPTWLGVPPKQDANDTSNIISKNRADWLIVDHYDIDSQWEAEVRSTFPDIKIMVVDDLANRVHDCDLLVDQTYGRTNQEYQSLAPENTRFCLSTNYALLRSHFKELREQNTERNLTNDGKCHILVTLGGGESGHPIAVIGKALNKLANDQLFSATVITSNTPEEFLSDYKNVPQGVEFVSFSNNIADEMMKADFVIGAGGGTSWERCCLGLPTVVLTIADNQIEIAKILNDEKAGISVKTDVAEIAAAVKTLLLDQPLREEMSKNAASLCDGNGVARVIGAILETSIEIKVATLSDANFIYDARYADGASKFYRNKDVPSFEDHVKWLERSVTKDDCILACLSFNEEKIAHVRIDKKLDQTDSGEIGICLAKEWRGKGIGRAVLNAANSYFASLGVFNIYAEVHESNIASTNIFEQAEYVHLSTDSDGFMRYLWQA